MTSSLAPRLTAHWSPALKQLEVAYLDGAVLRVERLDAESEIAGFRSAFNLLNPQAGVEVQASWLWRYDLDAGLAAQRFEVYSLIENVGGIVRSHSLPQVQSCEQLALACARRNRLSECTVVMLAGNSRFAYDGDVRQTRRVLVGNVVDGPGHVNVNGVTACDLLKSLKEKSKCPPAARPWILFGDESAKDVPRLANEHGVDKLIVCAHAGAVKTVELLLSDHYVRAGARFNSPSAMAGDPSPNLEKKVRAVFRDQMDEISRQAFKLGFDTDDLVCGRAIAIKVEDNPVPVLLTDDRPEFITTAMEICQSPQDNSVSDSDRQQRAYICGLEVFAIIETSKPPLPPFAVSSTIAGAGEPADRIVIGPGKMLACLCEIDVPAGWRAEWEPCGDVVMTRV